MTRDQFGRTCQKADFLPIARVEAGDDPCSEFKEPFT
jgi:hypothetical protein